MTRTSWLTWSFRCSLCEHSFRADVPDDWGPDDLGPRTCAGCAVDAATVRSDVAA
jgi:hypothetical protein